MVKQMTDAVQIGDLVFCESDDSGVIISIYDTQENIQAYKVLKSDGTTFVISGAVENEIYPTPKHAARFRMTTTTYVDGKLKQTVTKFRLHPLCNNVDEFLRYMADGSFEFPYDCDIASERFTPRGAWMLFVVDDLFQIPVALVEIELR